MPQKTFPDYDFALPITMIAPCPPVCCNRAILLRMFVCKRLRFGRHYWFSDLQAAAEVFHFPFAQGPVPSAVAIGVQPLLAIGAVREAFPVLVKELRGWSLGPRESRRLKSQAEILRC